LQFAFNFGFVHVELASGKGNNFAPHHCRSRRDARQIGRLGRAVAAFSSRLRPARILNDCERRRGPGGYIRSDDGAAVVTARQVLILLGCARRACQRACGKQHGNNRLLQHGGLSPCPETSRASRYGMRFLASVCGARQDAAALAGDLDRGGGPVVAA